MCASVVRSTALALLASVRTLSRPTMLQSFGPVTFDSGREPFETGEKNKRETIAEPEKMIP